MPHEVTTTDSGDILISAADTNLITITDRFSALYEMINVDTQVVSASAVFTDKLEATSGLATFLTVSALTVHTIDYSIHTTAKASGGHASAVPATAAGYIPIIISGVSYRLVLYNPSN